MSELERYDMVCAMVSSRDGCYVNAFEATMVIEALRARVAELEELLREAAGVLSPALYDHHRELDRRIRAVLSPEGQGEEGNDGR